MKINNMYKRSLIMGIFSLICSSSLVKAEQTLDCSGTNLSINPETVLTCFVNTPSSVPAHTTLVEKTKQSGLTIYTFKLISQFWPEKNLSQMGNVWQHNLKVYVPDEVTTTQSLLYINGGTPFLELDKTNPSPAKIDLGKIATLSQSVVADLQDNPNQYLAFDDNVPRREDGIVAYSWNKYIDDPKNHAFWPVHLPMVKAVIKAMDAIQSQAELHSFVRPEHFVLAGQSKRGWAAWLTALEDNRVNGLIPIVIDILNTDANIRHIKNSLGSFPLAFHDYVSQGVTKRLNDDGFKKLMAIEDPLQYAHLNDYKQRLAIPKFIINASSDDFFVPDSLLQYIGDLAGDNTIRILPNQRHYVDNNIVSEAISQYYTLILQKSHAPKVTWSHSKDMRSVKVVTDFIPQGEVTLWQAYNPTDRDFRIAPTNISYQPTSLTGHCSKKSCEYLLPKDTNKNGWTSRFVELTYQNQSERLVLTSPAFISPNVYPKAGNNIEQ